MKFRSILIALAFANLLAGRGRAQTYYSPDPPQSRSLGLFGGLAGAGVGAAIGQKGGDAVPGALIGGAIGAVSGAILGDVSDRDNARRNAYYAQAENARVANSVSLADVVSMTRAGLSDDVIINQVRTKGMAYPLTTSDIIMLKQQGVSDLVISSLQQQPRPATVIVQRPAPVIVEERYYGPSCYHWGPPCYHDHFHHGYHHYDHHPHSSVHFSFGH